MFDEIHVFPRYIGQIRNHNLWPSTFKAGQMLTTHIGMNWPKVVRIVILSTERY
jgi:hypothetical protein